MSLTDSPDLETTDRQRVYEYIQEHEPVAPETVESEDLLSVSSQRTWQIIAVLKRDGYITTAEGKLVDDYAAAEEAEHAGQDIEYTVRAARLDDLSGLAGVIRLVIESGQYIVGENLDDQLAQADTLLHGTHDEPPSYFVALVDGDVIGWASVEERDTEKLSGVAHLTMGLLDEYRGLGIGSTLLNRAVSWARENGYRKLASNIPATNESAIEFLEANDWAVVAVRPDHYAIDDTIVDEVLVDRPL